ncbi:MAG TPA: FHA domain-containing protein [Candidatus Acidoferrum sp.]|nr:FHA domain-containing protein [Candidatus Acidoferrum sp.]
MSSPGPQPISSWLIGSHESCDVVVKEPTVSGRHCRLTQRGAAFEIEDLGSTNGTFVDGQRIAPRTPVAVTAEQRILLGPHVPLAWPKAAMSGQMAPSQARSSTAQPRVIRIGRAPDCDVVLDYPVVSREHARIIDSGGQYVLEDLRSTNGTAVNHLLNRITTRVTVRADDDVYFGSFKISASRLLNERGVVAGDAACESVGFHRDVMLFGRDPQCDQPLDSPMISWHHAQLTKTPEGIFVEDLGSLNGTFVGGTRITGKTKVAPGQEIGLATFRFQVCPDGHLERRENRGNVSIEAAEVTVNAPDGTRLLNPVSLTVYPSELVALMGPAGAGKTTLLKALNGYTPPASGQVLFNGANLYRFYDLFRQQMGYVPQDDIVHSQLTVREALYFSAKLRTDLSDAEIDKRIDTVLEELGIRDKKNSLIGSPERKTLSGGQRKRVNIALELVTDTPVLFLDEPTSGLSSYDAEGVIDLLKRLARDGKTIITTIHQPSLSVFRKFDDLIMISRDPGGTGAMAYFGPAYPDSIRFFQPAKERSGGGTEEAAPLGPEMLLTGLNSATTPEWCERFAQSEYHRQFVQERAGRMPEGAGQTGAPARRRFSLAQSLQLIRRNAILKIRDRAQLVILLLQAPLFALLIVLIFGALHEPPNLNAHGVVSTLAASKLFGELGGTIAEIEFLMVVAAIWFGCNNAARDIVGEWTIYQRERMVNLKLVPYAMAKFAILCALCVLQCLTLLGIVYVFCHLKGSFAQTFSVLVLSSLVGAALGLAISARSSTTESAIALLPVVLLPVLALGGGVRAVYKMPEIAKTLSYAVPSRWAFEQNVIIEAQGHPCGYPPGLPMWNDCPTGGKGVDAATMVVPEAVVSSGDSKDPAPLKSGVGLRYTLPQTLGALGAMLALLLAAVLASLKSRDIH